MKSPAWSRGRSEGLLVLYGVRVLGALWIASRIGEIVMRSFGGYVRADALVFDRGGLFLAELVRVAEPVAVPVFAGVVAMVLLTRFVALVPFAMVILAGDHTARRGVELVDAALDRFAPLAWLEAVALLVEALTLAIVGLFGLTVRKVAHLTEFSSDVGDVVTIAGMLVTFFALSLTHDVARVAIVSEGRGAWDAMRRASSVLLRRGLVILASSLGYGVFGAAFLAAGFGVGRALGNATAIALVGSIAAHQAGLLAATFTRALFLTSIVQRIRAVGDGCGADEG